MGISINEMRQAAAGCVDDLYKSQRIHANNKTNPEKN
jgi:hypothetical protein